MPTKTKPPLGFVFRRRLKLEPDLMLRAHLLNAPEDTRSPQQQQAQVLREMICIAKSG
ncbi:MAG: hypothetical protein AB7O65_00235 [Candidatus Korobacteraceae bacterium]